MISRDLISHAYLSSSSNCKLVIVGETISRDGIALLLMIIFPGIIHQESLYTTT